MTNLTEQYHNGTLPDGFYYFNNGKETYIVHYDNIGVRGIESVSVVDKVPSYEENTMLKELLKECKLAIFDYPPYDLASDKIRLQIKINQVLGEE